MEQTESQHLPYPDENDPANAALQIQFLAETIDAKLVTQFAALREIVNPPTLVVRLSASITGVAQGVTTDVTFDEIMYESPASGWTFAPATPFFPETGYYQIGCFVASQVSGGVTANSALTSTLRYARIQQLPYTLYEVETYINNNWQSGTGIEYQTLEAFVRCDVVNEFPTFPGLADWSGISVSFVHNNAASTLNILAGSLMWAWKVSNLED